MTSAAAISDDGALTDNAALSDDAAIHADAPQQDDRLVVGSNNWVHGKTLPMQSGLASLFIDELMITRVPIVADGEEHGKFVFRPAGSLVDALPEQYCLSVELPDGERIEFIKNAPIGSGDSSFHDKLDNGYAVSAKAGYLYRPLSSMENYKEQIFSVYDEGRRIFSQVEGTSDLFAAYGSLLGLVRANAFIGHDDDFDTGFIVKANNPNEAAEIMYRVMHDIRAMGYDVGNGSHLGNFYLQIPDMPVLDIFLMYYREETGELCSYNLIMECELDDVLPVQAGLLEGHEVLTPNNPEKMMEAAYGENWRVPDPYFQWYNTPRHDMLQHAFMFASRAISAGEPMPEFVDPKLAPPVVEQIPENASAEDASAEDATADGPHG